MLLAWVVFFLLHLKECVGCKGEIKTVSIIHVLFDDMKNVRYLLVKAREWCLKWKNVILKHDFGADCTGTVPCKKIAFYQ